MAKQSPPPEQTSAERGDTVLEHAYPAALATMARAAAQQQKPGVPNVSAEQVKAAQIIIDRYERREKKREAGVATVPGVAPSAGPEGKVRLTEGGAAALSSWMKRTGTSPAALAGAMGTNQMTPGRALRREGWLTLEQAGRLVAYSGGELTGEQLFGADRAGAIPVYQARKTRAVEPARPTPQPTSDPDQKCIVDDVAQLGPREHGDLALELAYPAAAKTLADASAAQRGDGPPPSPSQIRSALAVVEIIGGKARQREKSEEAEAPLSEAALLDKLLFVEAQLTKAKRQDKMDSGEFHEEGLA